MHKDIELFVEEYRASIGRYKIHLILENLDFNEVFENFKLEEVIEYFGDNVLLDFIGEDRVKEYFNLQEKE